MQLLGNTWVAYNRKGETWTNIRGYDELITDPREKELVLTLKRVFASKRNTEEFKRKKFNEIRGLLMQNPEAVARNLEAEQRNRMNIECACVNLIEFFKEFTFSPNFRFVNTLARRCFYNSTKAGVEYVTNYFKLVDNPATNACIDKMKSAEFKDIVETFAQIEPKKEVNTRFKLYYGTQGTGKTVQAMDEADDNVMLCHSAMLPQDLMEDFEFVNGQATFKPSALQIAMVEGKTILLDEINLLPYESLRFLQSLLDGKQQFEWKGGTICIADDFQIIGTMNLQVNGMIYALPEPLVDRASELKEFVLTSDQLVGAVL